MKFVSKKETFVELSRRDEIENPSEKIQQQAYDLEELSWQEVGNERNSFDYRKPVCKVK